MILSLHVRVIFLLAYSDILFAQEFLPLLVAVKRSYFSDAILFLSSLLG